MIFESSMNYTAAKTKALSMSAKLLTSRDYEELCHASSTDALSLGERTSLLEENDRISSYIYAKPVRDFVKTMALCLKTNTPNLNTEAAAINHWSYVLWRKLGAVDKPSRSSLRRVLGTEMDLRNILWIYRLKQFHKIEGSAAVGHLLPAGYRLTRVTELVECKDAPALVEALAKSPYGEIFSNPADFRLGEQALAKAVRAQFRAESFRQNAACICKFLYEKHLEIRNIRTITEGIKFGFPPEQILARIC
ncbi:MAG: V-type ATPase subunit [Defluviitaleaceae bacterium]|nr:V-type ATPase subunit [Defluviitaleaceae bacterium]